MRLLCYHPQVAQQLLRALPPQHRPPHITQHAAFNIQSCMRDRSAGQRRSLVPSPK